MRSIPFLVAGCEMTSHLSRHRPFKALYPILPGLRRLVPMVVPIVLTTVAHAQGTMDFSGAQTLMGTFKTP